MSEAKRRNYLIACWGVFGFVAIIAHALTRLTPFAIEPIEQGMMEPLHWAVAGAWIVFMLYSEAYKGFHLAFSPRLAARAMHLAENPRPLHAIFAPAYVMGLFHATRKRLIVSWCLLVGIVALVIAVKELAQPWRGIVDLGVVIGLFAGTLSVLWYFARAARGDAMPVDPDIPAMT